jgi:TolB-like protein
MTSFLRELRRRRVIKVAGAYAVVAWLLAQVASVFVPPFDFPSWILQAFLVALVLGLPVAAALAWIYDITPEGIERTDEGAPPSTATRLSPRDLSFLFAGLAIVMVGFFFLIEHFRIQEDTSPEPASIVDDARQSIAVLPFVNIGGGVDNEYFSDGLTEETLNLLARIPNLKVIGRTSSFAFKGRNEDLREIGRALGVGKLLEGSVRMIEDRVRVTAQLIDAADGANIWSSSFERELMNVFQVQDDIAAAIIDHLSVLVGTNPTRGRPTEISGAYSLFLRARVELNAFQLREAEATVMDALGLDANFAEAHELLALIYWTQAGAILPARDAQELMGDAAARALEINPDLVLAQALFESGNLETYSLLREIEALEQAARNKPNDPWVLNSLLFNLRKAGYVQEALAVGQRLVDIDPLSRLANGRLQSTLLAVGRTEEALTLLAAFDHDKWFVGETYLAIGRDEDAIRNFEAALEENGISDSAWVRELVSAARDPATGQASLDARISEIIASMPEENPLDMERRLSSWYPFFGFFDRYYDYIFSLDLTDSSWTNADDFLDEIVIFRQLGITSDPRFLKVAELLGLTDVWEQRGPPDFCRRSGGVWACD